jgi:hypothetical protein
MLCSIQEYTYLEFPDGAGAEYTANIIAENIYAQCNIDGERYLLLKLICDHKKDGHATRKLMLI